MPEMHFLVGDDEYETVKLSSMGPGTRVVLKETGEVYEVTGWNKKNPPEPILVKDEKAVTGPTPEDTVLLHKGSVLAKKKPKT